MAGQAVEVTGVGPISGRCDAHDRLVEADEALAGLQVRLGGAYPGTLALAPLLLLVRKVRHSRTTLSEMIAVEDDGQPLTFHARVSPCEDGTRIAITRWRLSADHWSASGGALHDPSLLRQLAEAHIVLDAEQRVISGHAEAADLAELAAGLEQGFGRYWTDLVTLPGNAHRQPLHWRLLDQCTVAVSGSPRKWTAHLLPLDQAGFELLLVATTVLAPEAAEEGVKAPSEDAALDWKGLLGSKLAPALRMPINRIVANAETIRTRLAGPIAEQYVGYAADIADAGRHLLSLVEDLSDLETVEDESFAPAVDDIDLADCARRAAGILGVRAREKGIAVHVPGPDTLIPASGEFRRVLQILLNLIGNAIRYSPQGTTITIEGGSDGRQSWLAVSDEGSGLSPDEAEKVFDKFERLGRSGDGGSGLGLYISRKLARAMHGDLSVVSARDDPHSTGARFVLSLPSGQEMRASA
ncbi:MAG: sensor histidine kinase [Novosphingobium meiothermophilum]|uniref:sensor histidine kinase n=1 Tax=Novosphingobium TaxID=165696 RepID=UPI000D6E73B7|nr:MULTISPECIES: HAMP domain-containing sensor histidine kinase [Novosphingobium]